MSFWKLWLFPLALFTCAVLGPLVMTALLVGYHWIVARPMLSDGQYALFLAITVPSGGAAALSACTAIAKVHRNPKLAEASCFLGGVLTLLPALLYNAAITSNDAKFDLSTIPLFFENALSLLPVFAIGVTLILSGFAIRQRRSFKS